MRPCSSDEKYYYIGQRSSVNSSLVCYTLELYNHLGRDNLMVFDEENECGVLQQLQGMGWDGE